MRLTVFRELMYEQFGIARADTILADHRLADLGGVTANAAIEAGQDPREVWRALCIEFDVPRHRW